MLGVAGRRPLGQYNRRLVPSAKANQDASRGRYFAEMKAHFEEVSVQALAGVAYAESNKPDASKAAA